MGVFRKEGRLLAMGSPVQSLETQATTPAAPALAEAALRPESPAATTAKTKSPAAPFHYYPFWSPRFWHGMTLGPWLRLLRRNGLLSVHPFRYPLLIAVTFFSSLNGALRIAQRITHGKRLTQTPLPAAPLFIVGHWRSGTTYLHELMVQDQRFASPTSLQCFLPHHWLLTGWLFNRFGSFLLPKKRPMDNVETGWDRPQEDEFALLSMGAPSPYERMAFPNHPPRHMDYLTMEGLSDDELERWSSKLKEFLVTIAYKNPGKQIILKSPPHTGRVKLLAKLFPEARFVHISRNPYSVFASTRRLWQSLDEVQGLQLPRHEALDDYVFESFDRMYSAFERAREELPDDRICDVKYEDLTRDPLGQLSAIYQHLNLGDFNAARERVTAFTSKQRDYRTNQHSLDEATRKTIYQRWSGYFRRYGYDA